MAGNENAKSVKIHAVVAGTRVHPVSITTGIAVNAMPYCTIEYPPGAVEAINKASDMTSTEIFEKLKSDQESIFKPNTARAAVSATCEDTGAEFKFSGMPSNPAYNFSVTNVRRSDNIMAEFATVNAMDLSIYKLNPDRDDLSSVSKGGPLNEVIKDVFEFIIKDEHLEHYKEHTEVKKFVDIAHRINQANKHIFLSILEKSDKMGWDDLREHVEFGSDWKFLLARIASVLMSNNGGFFNNIVRLAEDFQCIFVPSMDGSIPAGKLISKMYVMADTETLTVPSIAMSCQLGAIGMYPVAAVAAKANNAVSDYDARKQATGYAIYPNAESNPNDIATILAVPGPPWFNCSGKVFEGVGESSTSKEVQDTKIDLDKIAARTKKRKKMAKMTLKIQGSVMEQWTKCAYYWQALGQTSVYLTSEFLSAKVGKYYTVKNAKGKTIFRGLLYSVTHSISAEAEDVSAETRLTFTQVRMKGANIPGIE